MPINPPDRANAPNAYYNASPSNYGNYAFVSLGEIIDNFRSAYIGEGKILPSTVRHGDIKFHANRAMQELSYDTLKSCKSLEVEVCPNLKVPLPHDYVNYTKITSVDSNGIEHIIYPTRHTSNPFAAEQDDTECDDCGDTSDTYKFTGQREGSTLKPQTIECDAGDVTCTFENPVSIYAEMDYSIFGESFLGAQQVWEAFQPGGVADFYTQAQQNMYWHGWFESVNSYCLCLAASGAEDNCGEEQNSLWTTFGVMIRDAVSLGEVMNIINNYAGWSELQNNNNPIIGNLQAFNGGWVGITNNISGITETSNAWDNYSSSGGGSVAIDTSTTTDLAVDADNYFQNVGQRYGLQPEHAQINGSFFIDCYRGMIHFSSNLSGKTVIIHYLSDHRGKASESIIPKLAEEAMYKWIAYGCLITRADTPEYVIQRFKKEKFAETRKAKIRISNIKIEEIAQIMRNKSKWIKH